MKILFWAFVLLITGTFVLADCEDTDGGMEPHVAGNVTDEFYKYTDFCEKNGVGQESCSGKDCLVIEGVCEGVFGKEVEYVCSGTCKDGACKERMVILATSDLNLGPDNKLMLEAIQYLTKNGYEIDSTDIYSFSKVFAKFEQKVILALKNRQAVLVVKGNLPESYKTLGTKIETFLKSQEVDYISKTFASENDLNLLFDFCRLASECDDNEVSTKDSCEGTPPRCKNTEIETCISNDNYCPRGCLYASDNDCPQCFSDEDCDDLDSGTFDACDDSGVCVYGEVLTCKDGDDFCPDSCTYETDDDCSMCEVDEDCEDDNPCTKDSCINTKCVFADPGTGCGHAEQCLPPGWRVGDLYCGQSNVMEKQKALSDVCREDYECDSFLCEHDKCKSPWMLTRLLIWIQELFS